VKIAAMAGQGKIIHIVGPAVLPGNNVLYVV
jgi:hypothetical protein